MLNSLKKIFGLFVITVGLASCGEKTIEESEFKKVFDKNFNDVEVIAKLKDDKFVKAVVKNKIATVYSDEGENLGQAELSDSVTAERTYKGQSVKVVAGKLTKNEKANWMIRVGMKKILISFWLSTVTSGKSTRLEMWIPQALYQ